MESASHTKNCHVFLHRFVSINPFSNMFHHIYYTMHEYKGRHGRYGLTGKKGHGPHILIRDLQMLTSRTSCRFYQFRMFQQILRQVVSHWFQNDRNNYPILSRQRHLPVLISLLFNWSSSKVYLVIRITILSWCSFSSFLELFIFDF